MVAKVYRDKRMCELDAEYPGYGLASHKGYATPEHREALKNLGPCVLHRKSFAPVAQIDLPWDEFSAEEDAPVSYTHLDVYKRQGARRDTQDSRSDEPRV